MADRIIYSSLFIDNAGEFVPLLAHDNLDGTWSLDTNGNFVLGGAIPAGTNNIGDVDVLSIAAGETHLGAVGGHSVCIDVTPTLSVGATYVANDYVGTDHTSMTFAGAARKNGGTGLIMGCILVDYKVASVGGELWLFDTAPAGLGDDSAAFTITDADALRCIGIIPISTYYPSALNSIGVGIPVCPMPFQCLPASMAIYGAFVTRGAPAWVNGDVTFRLRILQD